MQSVPLPFVMRGLVTALCVLLLASCAAPRPKYPGEKIYADVVFASPQGRDLRMDLYVPQSEKPVPVVVWIFGGSWKFGSNRYHVNVRDLTKHDIAVASIEYRLSQTAKYPAQLEDCRSAVAWLRANGKRYGIDPERIGVSGESAGGHLAALLGTIDGKDRVRAVLALFPATDLVALSRRNPGPFKSNSIDQLLGGPVAERMELAREASPVNHVGRSAPPFLIMHGKRDIVVPIEQSEELERRLKRAGVPVRLIVVRDKGHWFRLSEEQMDKVAGFFWLHFGMREQPRRR
jgi:acetyl esterase/lipase